MTRRRNLEARYQQLKVLYRISDLINGTKSRQRLLKGILREAVRAVRATSGTISLLDQQEQVLDIRVSEGMDPREARRMRLRVGEGVTGHAAQTGRPVRVEDVAACGLYIELKPGVASELAVPLRVEGRTIGVINVDSVRPAAFSADDEKLLAAVANQAAKVIQTSNLYERLTEQTRRLEALFAVGQALIGADPLPGLLQRITQAVLDLMDIKLCSVMLINERRELVLSAVSGGTTNYSQRPNLSVQESLVGEVVTRREPIQVFDVKKAPRYRSGAMARRERLASLLSVPIGFQDRLIGIINIYTAKPREFRPDEMQLLNAFASLCGIAIENAQRYERVLRAEESIRQADRLATLGILSAEIAHEVRNPVAVISMLLHSLQEDNAIAPGREKDVRIIADKLERINRIVSQVLNLSKRREARPEWVALNEVLDDLAFLVSHQLLARGVTLKRSFNAQLPPVLGDRGHFDQIFLNLILNAVQAMPNGGVLHLKTAFEPLAGDRPGRVVVSVRDTGVGIGPELVGQLFTPFVSSRGEGVGLGLFVSQKLLGKWGGTIDVRSSPGKGTTFSVSMPAETPAE